MRWLQTLLVITAIAALPALAAAQGMQISADGGMTRFLGEDQRGYGFNAYPGLSLGPLTLEAQLGYHHGDDGELFFPDQAVRGTTYVPVMVGGRVGIPLGVVVPWAGAHGGFAHIARKTSQPFGTTSYVDREWEPAFNVGAGIDLRFSGFGVGAGLWYHGAMDPDDPMRAANLAINLTIPL